LSLMLSTRQWLPVENIYQAQLISRLVVEERSFIKGMRYNLSAAYGVTNFTLTDCGRSTPLLRVVLLEHRHEHPPAPGEWVWRPPIEAMPLLPLAHQHRNFPQRLAHHHRKH
jgi:Protein of unknown function (DUF1173)